MNIKDKDQEYFTLENVSTDDIKSKDIVKKKKKWGKKVSKFLTPNWYILFKVWNSILLLFCLSNPYLVGFYAKWTFSELAKGWQDQTSCYGGEPRIVGRNGLHLKTTCTPLGE